MKKICKSVAVFATVLGLACMTSCVSVGDLVGSMFGGGGSGNRVAILDGRNNGAPYSNIDLSSNGKLVAQKPNSVNEIKGKWETSGNKDSLNNGDTITVTIEETTGKGTVRQISSKFVPGDPSTSNSDKPVTDHTVITYSVNLGTLGTYTYVVKKYESNK
ncbi:MAG: hypothetical protein K2J68_00090 [Treponemataceae bacterium]|nr:hypothetical protein [Treponemataceae bacterium]MDE5776713.1 hypothetical protein [Treponemataceae bacterium]MDE6718249.1 hypothetical protein [Treponemataceae bacterium]